MPIVRRNFFFPKDSVFLTDGPVRLRDERDHADLGRCLTRWALEHRPELVTAAREQARHLMMPDDDDNPMYLAELTARWFLER